MNRGEDTDLSGDCVVARHKMEYQGTERARMAARNPGFMYDQFSKTEAERNPGVGQQVRDFHLAFGQAAPELPTVPSRELREFREKLEDEEDDERRAAESYLLLPRTASDSEALLDAWTQVADAIGDELYVKYGRAVSYGLPIDKILQIIHEANMEKLGPDGKPMLNQCCKHDEIHHVLHEECSVPKHMIRPDLPKGKVLKPEGWVPPDERIKALLRPLLAEGKEAGDE